MRWSLDFNLATRLHRKNSLRTFGIPSENVYQDRRRFAKDDWACFLRAICDYIGVRFEWFDHCASCKLLNGDRTNLRPMLKEDIVSALGIIVLTDSNLLHFASQEKIDAIENEGFRRVFVEFAKNAFKDEINLWANKNKRKLADFQDTTRFPLYDELYQIISEEIDKFKLPQPVLVSWLTDEENEKAKEKWQNEKLPDISSIKDRFENVDAEYPEVNYNYFAELYREQIISESSMVTQTDPKAEVTKTSSTTTSIEKINENIISKTSRWMRLFKKR